MPKDNNRLSSQDWLARIGLDEDGPNDLLLDEEPLADLSGDPAEALRERFRQWQRKHQFQPGDLVVWKPGLMNKRYPRATQTAVVLEVLDPPVFDSEREAGLTYFREPLDLVLGMFVDEGPRRGDFLSWHYDSRRFQPWTSD